MHALSLLFALLAARSSGDAFWPHWRGPSANGTAPCALARRWSDTENVRWVVTTPGRGASSPVIQGPLLFFSTAVPTGKDAASGAPEEQSFELHALDRKSGATRWKAVARVATPHEGYHKSYGSYASASPITDGERVYVSFGSQGLFAYDLEGKLVWSFDPGVKLAMRNGFGEGLAPVLAGDVLVQVCDQEHDSFAFALDKRTGKQLWRVPRDEVSTWATPLVAEFGGRQEVVTGGTNRIRSYAPATGEILWDGPGLGVNVIPSVLRAGDLVLCMSGYRDARILALRLGGKGALGDDAVAWSSTQGCAYTASPVLCDGLYYTVSDRGLVSCFDAQTGKVHYLEERLPRGSSLKSSPIAAGDFLYVPTESGDVHLIRLGPKFEVVQTNTLADQVFVASPAAAEGDLFLRSWTHLYCIRSEQ